MLNSINFYIKKTKSLKPSEIELICALKDTEWHFGIEEQYNWFQKEIKKNDIHILLKNKNNLLGYTCLRYKKFYFKNGSNSFLLFDSHIIKKNFRNNGFGEILITEVMKIIKNKKILSLLFCKKSQIKYYKKFNWNIVNKNKYLSNKNKKNLYLMFLGKKNDFKKKFII
jgi:N-acetylglutamate synthase-like GNAT family acetyltransferase